MTDEARVRFAAELRACLDAEPHRSRSAVARDAAVSRGYLHRVEHGQRWPSRAVVASLDDTLGAAGALLTTWRNADTQVPTPDRAADRSTGRETRLGDVWTFDRARMLGDMLDSGCSGDGALSAEDARRLVHEWMVTDSPQTVALDAGRRIGTSTADTIARRVAQLRRVDDYVAGGDLRPLVEREVTATVAVLREGAYSDQVGRALLGAVAELAQLAGWVVADAGALDLAARYLLGGVHAAHAAGDRATAANLISTLSYQEANTADPHRAVLLSRSALRGAPRAPATVRALLGERVAWAHARAGDRPGTERALSAVETAFDQRREGDEPEWTYWLDLDEITVMAGRCYVELGDPDRAIPLLTDVLDGYDEHRARESALYLSWLAEAHAMSGDIDHAATLATRVLDLTSATASARSDTRVAVLGDRLRPHADSPGVVADFIDRLDGESR